MSQRLASAALMPSQPAAIHHVDRIRTEQGIALVEGTERQKTPNAWKRFRER